MEEIELVPKRRFDEFINNGNWKPGKMEEVVDVYDGTHQTPRYTDSGIMFLSVEDISTLKSNKYISQNAFEKEFKNYPETGDVFMTRIGDIGTANVVKSNENIAYYVSLALLKNKNIDPYFLKESIHSKPVRKELWHRTLHIAFPKKINMNEIEKIVINYPDIIEQQKIGRFFKLLDERIANQERKIEKVKDLKSAYLTEMFPQEGETVPERRFEGFTNEWKEIKLGQIASVAMNKRIFKEQTSPEGDVPFYKIGTFGGEPDAYISRELFEEYKSKYSYPEIGDILLSASGSIGRTVEYTGKDEYFQDSNIIWLEHGGELDNLFLKQFYSIVEWEGLEGSTIKRLYNKNILETTIKVPNLKEQQKIGQFFKNLDNQIANEEKKLDKLKSMKAAYLEEMFI